jgi:phage tail sheath protein FI
MPIQPTYPGVYVQEVSSGVRPITGVATSIAAFFGRTLKGPINKAVRCLNYSDFLREYGGGHSLSDLGSSVRQFFDNGGTDCYIVRLAKMPMGVSGHAAVTLRNGSASSSKNVMIARAKAPGVWGQDVKLMVDYNTTNPDDTFNLTVTQESGGAVVKTEVHSNLTMNPRAPRFAPVFVTQSSRLIDLALHADMGDPTVTSPAPSFLNDPANTPRGFSQSLRVFTGADPQGLLNNIAFALRAMLVLTAARQSEFVINLDGKTDIPIDLRGVAIPAAPVDSNAITSPIQIKINSLVSDVMPGVTVTVSIETFSNTSANPRSGVLRIRSDSNDAPNVTIRSAASNDFAGPLMLGVDNGGLEVARFSNLRPVANATYYAGGNAGNDVDIALYATKLNEFSGLLQDAMTAVAFDAALAPAPIPISINLKTTSSVAPFSANFIDAGSGAKGLKEKLRIIQQAVNSDVNSPCTAELWGCRLAFRRKKGTLNDSTTIATTGAAVLGSSFTVNTQRYSLGILGSSAFQSAGTSGSDGAAPGQAEYEGDPVAHTGFYALDKVDLFNLMVLPADSEFDVATVRGTASAYCDQRRAFLLLDAPAAWTVNDHPAADATTVNSFRIGVSKKNAAIFYPRVQYSDAGIRKYIGPSGMIAGLMARTDSQRGVWKAPAGTEADLRGVLDVELNLTDAENGVLNKLGVNCIRKFPNGIVNWGARTLDGSDDFGSEWKYIPIRRLALFLEESLFRGTKWVVFEPNDEPLWAKIRMNLNAFMMSLFRQGAFQGATPDKAFFVKCDGETTTANDRNLGIVNIQVGFAPLKPAEFVIISIQQIPDA